MASHSPNFPVILCEVIVSKSEYSTAIASDPCQDTKYKIYLIVAVLSKDQPSTLNNKPNI